MRDSYERFYRAAPQSSAHQTFCERVFGADLCQHGFADLAQPDALMAARGLRPGRRALDLGCGNGMISERISDRTGAHVVGIDYVAAAPEQFDARTLAPGSTPLGAALTANGLRFTTLDPTAEDESLADLREAVLDDLRPQVEEQDLMFVYENRTGDARGTAKAIAAGLHRRYLYRVRK